MSSAAISTATVKIKTIIYSAVVRKIIAGISYLKLLKSWVLVLPISFVIELMKTETWLNVTECRQTCEVCCNLKILLSARWQKHSMSAGK